MSARLSAIANTSVRAWTWIYTRGLPRAVGDRRRREIESDLWECRHDRAGRSDARVAVEIVLRLLLGAADDICWRLEHRELLRPRHARALIAIGTGFALVGALGIYTAAIFGEAPPPPDLPAVMQFVAVPPAPPPPPPPPPADRRLLIGAPPPPPLAPVDIRP